jgi:hypothetical protein
MPRRKLTQREADRLAELEDIVRQGIERWFMVGRALEVICTECLWQGVCDGNWEDYCQQRWKISRSYAWVLRSRAKVAEDATAGGAPLPSAGQVAELAGLPTAELRQQVWEEAVAGGGEGVDLSRVKQIVQEALNRLPEDLEPRPRRSAGPVFATRRLEQAARSLRKALRHLEEAGPIGEEAAARVRAVLEMLERGKDKRAG